MQSIPKKITPCPILQAVVELRFETVLPSDAVFGILYSLLSSQYNTFEKLPILQIPEILRSQDPNLRYQPAYKLIDDNF
ncbi:MAG: TIGR04255 family protein, partial [Pseudanabaena sp.]|nr:TIGR04255 family protein [Pseudanabaena sp. 42896M_M3]